MHFLLIETNSFSFRFRKHALYQFVCLENMMRQNKIEIPTETDSTNKVQQTFEQNRCVVAKKK